MVRPREEGQFPAFCHCCQSPSPCRELFSAFPAAACLFITNATAPKCRIECEIGKGKACHDVERRREQTWHGGCLFPNHHGARKPAIFQDYHIIIIQNGPHPEEDHPPPGDHCPAEGSRQAGQAQPACRRQAVQLGKWWAVLQGRHVCFQPGACCCHATQRAAAAARPCQQAASCMEECPSCPPSLPPCPGVLKPVCST